MPPCFASCPYVAKPDTRGTSKTCKGIDMKIVVMFIFSVMSSDSCYFIKYLKILQYNDEQTGNPYQVTKL